MSILARLALMSAAMMLLAACTARPSETGPDDDAANPDAGAVTIPEVTGNEQDDFARLDAMKTDARALARADGCATSGQCRSAPLGAKPCGGPWEYLVYCSVSTDSAALYRQLDAVRQFEDSLNRHYHRASTCDLAIPPQMRVEGSVCRAVDQAP